MPSLHTLSDLFEGLSGQEEETIRSFLKDRHFPKGSVIFSACDASDSVFIIKNGLVKLISYSEKGEEMILKILKRGGMFGELVLAGGTRCITAMALSDVHVAVISRDDFLRLLESNSRVSMNFIEILSRRILKMGKEIADFGHTWSYERLGIVLLELIEEHGVKTPEGYMIPFRLTHEDLANLIGSTRETVTHQIKRLCRKGLLRRIGKHLIINRSLLSKYVHS